MEEQPRQLANGFYIIYEADESYQCQSQHKAGIFPTARQEISQRAEIKDDAATSQSYACMRAAFVWLVDDVTFVGYLKIKSSVTNNRTKTIR